ncbi:hypothetical protein FB451DRAFT_1184985 [Mycena latifolia]|nr:hypothetical protein FB451DRAFT_1184985 [Mycena latifolia]
MSCLNPVDLPATGSPPIGFWLDENFNHSESTGRHYTLADLHVWHHSLVHNSGLRAFAGEHPTTVVQWSPTFRGPPPPAVRVSAVATLQPIFRLCSARQTAGSVTGTCYDISTTFIEARILAAHPVIEQVGLFLCHSDKETITAAPLPDDVVRGHVRLASTQRHAGGELCRCNGGYSVDHNKLSPTRGDTGPDLLVRYQHYWTTKAQKGDARGDTEHANRSGFNRPTVLSVSGVPDRSSCPRSSMHPSPLRPTIPIIASIQVLFGPNGLGITWDNTRVQPIVPDFTQATHPSPSKIVHEIKFEADVFDIAVHVNDLFCVDRNSRRQLQRRTYLQDHEWTKEHPLCSYKVHLFSFGKRSQTGPALALPDEGVNATIHAGKGAVSVKLIGPHCVALATFWKTPIAEDDDWHCLHQELIWTVGFKDAEQEITHINQPDEADASLEEVAESFPGWRFEYWDKEIIDYTFITDTFALRLRERALENQEGEFWAEVIDLTKMVCSRERQTAPAVVKIFIRHTFIYKGMVIPWINAPTRFSDGNWLSITLILLTDVYGPFIEYAWQDFGPTCFGPIALFPSVDIDPNSPSRPRPIYQYSASSAWTVGDVIEVVYVPFMSLFADTLCMIYRDCEDAEPETRKSSRGWFIRLEHDVLECLGHG